MALETVDITHTFLEPGYLRIITPEQFGLFSIPTYVLSCVGHYVKNCADNLDRFESCNIARLSDLYLFSATQVLQDFPTWV